jgi:light-regulated signal transduction histidine kinase (bacteriophytochrome)
MRTDAEQPGQPADLTHCDKEPIHIPGREGVRRFVGDEVPE